MKAYCEFRYCSMHRVELCVVSLAFVVILIAKTPDFAFMLGGLA